MSRRNLILLIIFLCAVTLVFFGYLYITRTDGTKPEDSGGGSNFFSGWNPFSTKPSTSGTTPEGETPIEPEIPGEEIGSLKLKKVSTMPIAGYGVFQKERITQVFEEGQDGNTTIKDEIELAPAVRYVEKERGIIYQTYADIIKENKFSSTIIPRIYEAFFGNKGESVVMRYLKSDDETIETYIGRLPKEFAGEEPRDDNEISGSFLPSKISDVSISTDNTKLFYLFNLGDGVIGSSLEFSSNKKTQVFESSYTEWLSQWPTSNLVMLTTKPASGVPGYMYKLDINTKAMTKVIGDINGLTTLTSPTGRLVLYAGDNLSLNLYDTSNRNSLPVGIRTLPEKCSWTKDEVYIYCAVPKNIPQGEYPDVWYQGIVSFNDELWRIDPATGITNQILNPAIETKGEEIDAIRLSLDDSSTFLFFINKKDNFLWEFSLK